MKLLDKKVLLINFIISLVLSILIFYLSNNQYLWSFFWQSLSIPPQAPFSDLKAHVYFFNCFEDGINIYKQKCNLIPLGGGAISTHPPIWLKIIQVFNLNSEINYNIFILTSYVLYFLLFLNFFFIFKNFDSKIFLLIFFFSTTNFLLIERFSTDLLIFIFVGLIIYFNSKLIKASIIFVISLLKFYPIFLVSIFIDNKKFFYIFFLAITSFILIFYLDEIASTNENLIDMALLIAYGSRTMIRALFYLSDKYNLFLNEGNYEFYRNIFLLILLFYSFIITILSYLSSFKTTENILNSNEKLFLIGGSIYIGTFIFGANADYRLIFLLFTIPYIIELKNVFIKSILSFSIILSINSFIFQSGEPNSINYFSKAFLIFGCKFLIFTLFLIFFGKILKKLNFLKL